VGGVRRVSTRVRTSIPPPPGTLPLPIAQ
jgi:hypothetical protein